MITSSGSNTRKLRKKSRERPPALLSSRAFLLGVRLLTFSLVTLVMLAGCGSAARPGTVTVAIGYEPATLDPSVSSAAIEFYVEEAVFDGLLKVNSSGKLVPDLALEVPSLRNGGISKDLRTITYHLRRDVLWQDGVRFTAADVLFTYKSLISGQVASPQRSLYEEIASVQTPSPYTVVVHLRKPSAAAAGEFFVGGVIIPKHVLLRISDIRRSAFNSHPVGTGPFAVRTWRRGDYIDLVANDRYFAGKPHIQNLRISIVPASTTRAALLRAGALDVATLKATDLSPLRGSSGIRLLESRSSDIYYLEINTRRAPLDDRRVRQALAYAVNRTELTKPFAGMASPAYSLLPPGSYAATEQTAPCTGDHDSIANRLLARSGWSMRKNGGRERGAQRLAVTIVYDPGPVMGGMALQLQQAWKKIGVQTTLRPLPYGLLYGDRGLVTTGRYDVSVEEFDINAPGDLVRIAGSSSLPPAGFNYPRYVNANVDRWLNDADATGDEAARSQLYGRVDRALCRDVPFIPLVWQKYVIAVNRRVQGFAAEPEDSDLWNVASWSLK